jgi:hypothetical protein
MGLGIKQPGHTQESVGLPTTYEALVKRSPQGSIFAHRWWLEAVAPGSHEILESRSEGGLHAGWPLVYSERDGAKHICMPALTQKLGILVAPSDAKLPEVQSTNQRLATELIRQLGNPASFHQNFHENFRDWLPFYWHGYTQTTRYTYVLEDISDLGVLWRNMRGNTRQNIRKAQKLGITVRDDLDLAKFLELNRKTFLRQGKGPLASDELIYRLDQACWANAGRKIFAGVDPQGRVHGAVYVAWADDAAYYLMGGGEPELRESAAQILALWEAITFASSVAKRFDFEGSMLPQVERIFRGFGARQVPYFSISKLPPVPTSLKGFVKAAIKNRWSRVRKTITAGFRDQRRKQG